MARLVATSHTIRANFWRIPKNASTFIVYRMAELESEDARKKLNESKSNNTNFYYQVFDDLDMWIPPEEANNNGYKNFCIVRHPVDRFISAYKYFFKKRPASFSNDTAFAKMIRRVKSNNTGPEGLINGLSEFKDENRDNHFKSQASIISEANNIVTLRLEELPNNLAVIDERLVSNLVLNTTSDIEDPEIKDVIRTKIERVYREDLKIWKQSHGNL